jgi:hypothetical protein
VLHQHSGVCFRVLVNAISHGVGELLVLANAMPDGMSLFSFCATQSGGK